MNSIPAWQKLIVFGVTVIFFSCQKELSRRGPGIATGTIGVSAGVCTPVSIGGDYTQGTPLATTNTVTLKLTIAFPGNYTIATNTVNGVSFFKTGTFTVGGEQTVNLNGTGTPLNHGNYDFTVTFGNSTCNFSLQFASAIPPATGSLGGSPGSCTPVTYTGLYTQGIILTLVNTVKIQINVATVGTYSISTNSVNGVNFSNSGTFTTTGLQELILKGAGTPTNSGSQIFTLTFGSSTCNFSILFAVNTSPATGTLGGGAGSCTPVTISGTYTPGVALSAANTVQIQVTVATLGNYIISTNAVNGVSFANAGVFTTPGLQTLILTGTGTPNVAVSQDFIVSFDNSNCSFSITFGTGTTTTNYFPRTINSSWALGNPSDSLLIKVIPYTLTAGGNAYSTFIKNKIPASGLPDSFYYRKTGGDYFEFMNTKKRFFLNGPGMPPNLEYIFLKDNVPEGTTWNSPNTTGTNSLGNTFEIFIKMTLFEKATTPVTSGVVTSPDVIKIKYEYLVTIAPASPFYTEERWFAKDIGLIHYSYHDGTPPATIYKIGRYQIF